MDSTLGIVVSVCYLGVVCSFQNQLQTSLTGKNTTSALSRFASNVKAGLAPAAMNVA